MATPEQSSFRKMLPRIILLVVLGVGAWFGFSAYQHAQTHEETDNAQIESYMVPVLPRIAGYVKTVAVNDYDKVEKGQLLMEIDDAEYQLQLAEMEATYRQMQTDVENAKASLRNAELTIKAQESNLKATALRRDKAKSDAERDARLLADKAITRKQSDDSRNNSEVLDQQYVAGQADVLASRSRLDVLRSALHKAEASLDVQKTRIDQQKLKLTYSKVYATSSGRIGRKSVEPGQYIQNGQTTMTIVQDSTLWVVANFKETQVENLRIGSEAIVTADAFPNTPMKGKIVSFSEATGAKFSLLPPDNASGNFVKVTQKIPVKIEIENLPQYRNLLRAGMNVEVSVKTK
ncbi:HlyD family secretion protein [Siphonobacter curvatus]|uniref:Secretion protein HlyD n=1 Tax=Siphonobacter curvatus TaxID=2094562 RepID=A0A2S7ISH6_9BACT|nr:HlyD family secretion protein [Siphonobacter curvatus]PQA60673.1 secretion protein HlyD [Siphonobacter curvatus]